MMSNPKTMRAVLQASLDGLKDLQLITERQYRPRAVVRFISVSPRPVSTSSTSPRLWVRSPAARNRPIWRASKRLVK